MIVRNKNSVKRLLAAACLAAAFSQGARAFEVGGVKLDDTVIIANRELKLNGAGVRYKAIFKVYAAGLYLPEKKNTVAEILALSGPRRVQLVMMRDVSSDELGQAFMKGLNNNSDKVDKSKILTQTMQFGQMFALLPGLKKGDVLALDWIPSIGTQCQLNGRKIGEVMLDQAFYNAVLKIWIGEKPVDFLLKPELLGAPR
ncbi:MULTISPECIES: chalcone isomerase family protein [unclassified Janthinobacterium]|uniref:chalcone isomerase family protein n=1 Tax=unclassified Janthinobacterium TaxID=2610881 RepID=UPI00034AD42A|nr:MULTISPECIES: chalcone isomerase family protein [unclassified Janthinobacterium]MEC5160039.1 hypothetical protein [Janthinobacterium sp. CG_S6]